MLEMNNGMLTKVCGGNYWNEDLDSNPRISWYEIGEKVEVYMDIFHKFTQNSTILEKKI